VEEKRPSQGTGGRSARRLAIAAGVLSSLLLTSISIHEVIDFRRREYAEARESLAVFSSALTRQAAEILRSQKTVVRQVARTLNGDSNALSIQERFAIARATTENTCVARLFLYTLTGALELDTSGSPEPQAPLAPSKDLLTQAVSYIVDGPVPGLPYQISISEGLLGGNGQYRWLATSWIDFAPFAQTVAAITRDTGYQVALATEEGRILYRFPESARFDSQEIRQGAFDAWGKAASHAPIRELPAGAAAESVITRIEGAPLALQIALPTQTVNTAWQRRASYLAVLSTAGIGLIWLLIATILRQVKQTERVAESAERGEAMFVDVLSRLREAVIATDTKGTIRFANSNAFIALAATSTHQLIGQQIQTLLPPEVWKGSPLGAGGNPRQEASHEWAGCLPTLAGSSFHAEVRICGNGLHGTDGLVITIHDASERKAYEARVVEAATIDPVTNVSNMHAFRDRLDRLFLSESDRDQFHAVLAVQLSAPQGAPLDDSICALAADRLTTSIRDSDSVASEGSGRFFVLARNVSEPIDVAIIARRIAACYEAPLTPGGETLRLRARTGIALFPVDAETSDALVASAKKAAATANAEHFVYANEACSRQLESLREQADALRTSFGADNLKLNYAPMVCLKSNVIVGAIVTPLVSSNGRYIPLARLSAILEETRISALADECVLRSLLADLRACQAIPAPRLLIVPVHRDSFTRPGFLNTLREAVDALPTKWALGVSILEPVESEHWTQATVAISDLATFGVQVFLSDYGNGLASLPRLITSGVQGAILDRSQAPFMAGRDDAFAFVTAATAVAANLGIKLVATGVKDAEVASMLAKMGVSYACGPLYGTSYTAPVLPEPAIRESQTTNAR
jgi:EAL domain-containing protein (putative c-di-GMP-specific phosphodiesterase class I)/GGDEF domain-containing protein